MQLVSHALGQPLYRFGKCGVLKLHDECDDVATGGATKAMEISLGWRDVKGRTLLVMEWTETFLLPPARVL